MQNKGGVEEEGLESKAGFCHIELGVSSFQVGLWESVQVRAVSGSLMGRGICYISCLWKSRPYLRIILGEAIELEDPENNEIVIGNF